MTIGKAYYIACVIQSIDTISGITAFILAITSTILFGCFVDLKHQESQGKNVHQQVTAIRKCTKISITLLVISCLLNVFTLSREDFMIAVMTKDYKPEQIYNMTKEELKGGIDYIVKSIEEVKKYQR